MARSNVVLCGGLAQTIDIARRWQPVRTSYGLERTLPVARLSERHSVLCAEPDVISTLKPYEFTLHIKALRAERANAVSALGAPIHGTIKLKFALQL